MATDLNLFRLPVTETDLRDTAEEKIQGERNTTDGFPTIKLRHKWAEIKNKQRAWVFCYIMDKEFSMQVSLSDDSYQYWTGSDVAVGVDGQTTLCPGRRCHTHGVGIGVVRWARIAAGGLRIISLHLSQPDDGSGAGLAVLVRNAKYRWID